MLYLRPWIYIVLDRRRYCPLTGQYSMLGSSSVYLLQALSGKGFDVGVGVFCLTV